ncbi:ganglioside GM2 activator-like isoform X2 [Hyla sarda]|uniref:ganglioside GM2 activator-like isoform X2 n=1 Tax=Hyla sarda TaxID=327740 RepID=UPI0024C214AB|nr:ganglioside GM2 activator-like isoform X2 [Hyla sarda]
MANLAFCFLVAFAAVGQLTEALTVPWRLATDVKSITWENCDSGDLPGTIKSLSISPDPVSMPGDVTVSLVLNTDVSLSSPLQIKITAEKELLGEWLTVPCVDKFGSCTYTDICELLDSFFKPGQQCPGPLATYGLPCHCPFKAGSYALPTTTFKIPNLSLPSWMADGSYRVTGVLTHNNKEIGCAKFTFSLSSASSWWW